MHVAASRLLDRYENVYRMSLYCTEDLALAYLALQNWRRNKLHIKLALTPCPKKCLFSLNCAAVNGNVSTTTSQKDGFFVVVF
jgi:hypothetical protein